MKYFVCSDIHGFYDEWINALKEKGVDIDNSSHKIILCGDAFDRGEKSVEIFNFLKTLQEKNKLIYIRGNHEEMFLEWAKDLKNANLNDYKEYFEYESFKTAVLFMKNNLIDEVVNFINQNSVNYFETNKYVFVHGWIPTLKDDSYNPNWRNTTNKEWLKAKCQDTLKLYKNKIFEPNKILVAGHLNCSAFWHEKYPSEFDEFGDKANFEPFIDKNFIALDAYTQLTHKINVIVLED